MLSVLRNIYNLFFNRQPKPSKQLTAEQVKAFTEDSGIFYYNDDGFLINEEKSKLYCKWADIETIIGYKLDLITTDEICLEAFFNDGTAVRLNESMPGWYQFNLRLVENIPEIDSGWEVAIMLPPFTTNLTLLYDKQGRTLEEAIASYPRNLSS